jgi:hypothetical protein
MLGAEAISQETKKTSQKRFSSTKGWSIRSKIFLETK